MLENKKYSVDPGSITIFSHPKRQELRPGDMFDSNANLSSGCYATQLRASPFRNLTYGFLIGSAFLFSALLIVLLK